jgi:hypothetical protein
MRGRRAAAPARNGPRLRIIGDAREQPARFDRGGQRTSSSNTRRLAAASVPVIAAACR